MGCLLFYMTLCPHIGNWAVCFIGRGPGCSKPLDGAADYMLVAFQLNTDGGYQENEDKSSSLSSVHHETLFLMSTQICLQFILYSSQTSLLPGEKTVLILGPQWDGLSSLLYHLYTFIFASTFG